MANFILQFEFCSFFPQNIREFVTKYSLFKYFSQNGKKITQQKNHGPKISGGGVCDLWTLGPRDALMIYAMQFSLKLYSVKLFMKEGSLFCSYEIHSTRTGMLQIMFLVSLESS
jgi:hypothetical protein